MRGKWLHGALVAAVLSCVVAAPAGAATVVGQAVTPVSNCTPGGDTEVLYAQTGVSSGASYTMPAAGVITSWSTMAGGVDGAMTLAIYRGTADPVALATVAEDVMRTYAADSGLHTYAVQIPVQPGDFLGMRVAAGECALETGDPNDTFRYKIGGNAWDSDGAGRFSVAAQLEPDADRDGFGDETQDGCPTNASTQGACPPPPCPAGTSPGVTCKTVSGVTTFTGTAGADRIVGTPGRDVVLCGDGADTVTTGAGDDEVRCGAGADRVDTGLGNDRLFGELGNDRLVGGPGNDRLNGGDDQDRIGGGSGKDTASGGNGRDIVGGGSGNDKLNGNAGADRVSGDSGNDSVKGASGNDRLFGGSGKDRLSGGSGKDRLAGGTGRDKLAGGPGTDKVKQ